MKIVLTSYTPITSSGGVPRWCRDFKAGFAEGEVVHYSWTDVIKARVYSEQGQTEWTKAATLNKWLVQTKKLLSDDILIGDGFWTDTGIMHPIDRTVQTAHGNWSHTTLSDVKKGIQPEFPEHHAAQLAFRRRFAGQGGRTVAVSDFIANQCKIQWGFYYSVINNGIDLNKFVPPSSLMPRKRPIVVNFATTTNKGFDHIKLLEKELDADVLLLDDAATFYNKMQSERRTTKYQALAQADLVVLTSAHEGNSYACLETLSSAVPVVSYDVGLMWKARRENAGVGALIDRDERDPKHFLEIVTMAIEHLKWDSKIDPRGWVSQFSLQNFQSQWRDYVQKEFGFVSKTS